MTHERTRTQTVTIQRTVTQVERTCPVCRQRFWGFPTRRYCGLVCKNRMNYQRHAEARRQHRREHYRRQQQG